MIKSISFRNFKALKHVDVPLEPLTVIVGPNASGKSSVLEGLDAFANLAMPFHVFADEQHSKTGSGDVQLSAELTNGSVIALGSPIDGEPFSVAEETKRFPKAMLLQLNVGRLSQPHYGNRSERSLGRDGSGLASVLARIALNRPDNFAAIVRGVKRIVPSVERIRFDRVPITRTEYETISIGLSSKEGDTPSAVQPITREVTREFMGDAIIFDMVGAPDLPASAASSGTLIVLGLLTVLHGANPPELLLLDDIDQGLHPKAQKELVGLLRELMEQNPKLQIVATSHSPYLLHELDPREVRVTVVNDDGTASCASLTDHPKFQKWKDEFSPGEMWSTFGEAWVKQVPQISAPSAAGS